MSLRSFGFDPRASSRLREQRSEVGNNGGMARRWLSLVSLAAVLAVVFATACGPARDRRERNRGEREAEAPASEPAADTPSVPPVDPAAPRVVILGDSLTAGLGLSPKQAYPTVLQERLSEAGLRYAIVNAGVSG